MRKSQQSLRPNQCHRQFSGLPFVFAGFLLGTLAGCGGGSSTPDTTPSPTVAAPDMSKVTDVAEAGVPVTQSTDEKETKIAVRQASLRAGGARPDPFALRSDEKEFDLQQNAERVFGTAGWSSDFNPTSPFAEAPNPIPEPQPYRRLAGVVVGDSVLALIDMGNGQTYLIRPGMQIPDSDWTVSSIDMDKAVLKRGGSRLPHEVSVRLELPPPGANANTGFAPGGGTNPGFGGPSGGMSPGGGMSGAGN